MNKEIPTSWEKLSKWYKGMVGDEGSKFHQAQAIPVVMNLLGLKANQRVLDIGCGTGVLAKEVAAYGGKYTGIDASKTLIDQAVKLYGKSGKFYVGDATDLKSIPQLLNTLFDKVVFMLSIQDMDPLNKIIYGASNMLTAGGQLVIFMTHPAFRIPRQSGWGLDQERGLIYRRVDRYLSAAGIPLETKTIDTVSKQNSFVKSYTFHRPIGAYVEALVENGLVVDRFLEIPTYKVITNAHYTKQERKAYGEFPLFLALRAVKTQMV